MRLKSMFQLATGMVIAVGLIATPAMGQRKGGGGGGKGGGGGGGGGGGAKGGGGGAKGGGGAAKGGAGAATNTPAPPPNPALVEAKAEVATDTKAFADLQAKMISDFQQSDDYKAAVKAVKDATDAYEAAKVPVLAGLEKSSSAYRIAKGKENEIADKLKTLKEQDANSWDISQASEDLFEAGNALAPIERNAVESDPVCVGAKEKLDAAIAKLNKLMSDFMDSMKQNADYIAAKQAISDAQTKVASLSGGGTPPAAAAPAAGAAGAPAAPAAGAAPATPAVQ